MEATNATNHQAAVLIPNRINTAITMIKPKTGPPSSPDAHNPPRSVITTSEFTKMNPSIK
jgi:hypothetical protein